MVRKILVLLAMVGLALAAVGCLFDQNPVAVISTLGRVQPGQSVLADGGSSYSPGGTAITNFEWNFGDGTPVVSSGTSAISHSYALGGDYLLTLVVTNQFGSRSSPSTAMVSVNHRPVAAAKVSQEDLPAGQVVYILRQGVRPEAVILEGIILVPAEYWKLDASVSYDLDGVIASYHWRWADHDFGASPVIWVRVPSGSIYTLILEVFDNEGARGWSQVNIGAIG